jgi:hypothetical protein
MIIGSSDMALEQHFPLFKDIVRMIIGAISPEEKPAKMKRRKAI